MGLLDTMFANPDSAQALGLLGAGLMQGNPGGGFQAALGILSPEAKLKRDLMTAQVDNYKSEVAQRAAALEKQSQIQKLLTDTFGGGSASMPQMGQLGSGSFGAVPPPAGAPAIPQSSPAGSRLASMSPDTLALLKANGLDLVDVAKLARPDMQVSNGFAYDKNRVQPGFLPQLNVAQNGQSSMIQIGPDGQPVMSAPRGSLETYSAFRQADEAAKAGSDLVKVFNPATQREEYVPRSRVLGAQQLVTQPQPRSLPAAQPGVRGNFQGDPAQVMEGILAIKDPQERANAMAAFTEQAKRTQGFTQGAGFAAGPSMQESTTAAANKEYQTKVAGDTADQRKSILAAGDAAPVNIAKMQRIGQLLSDVDGGKLTPAGFEIASALNSLGVKVNSKLGNVQAAQAGANEMALQLRSPQGGAGMPGALSDKDREFLVSMTPNITQSAEGRQKVVGAYIALQQRNQQIAQFARNYEKKYGRLDNGFFDQLQQWSNSNPLFRAQ